MGVPKATMGGSESPITSIGASMGVPKATMGVEGPYGGPSVPYSL